MSIDIKEAKRLGLIPVGYIPEAPKQSKYRNTRCEYNGLKFDSLVERDRWIELEQQLKHRKIHHLALPHETVLKCEINGSLMFKYIPDFTYMTPDGHWHYEDVKGGATTPEFKLKKRIIEATHNVKITEVRWDRKAHEWVFS